MNLGYVLSILRALPDLRHLAQALGFTPLWGEVSLSTRRRPCGTSAMVAVARVGDFPWFATEASDPPRTVRSLAQHLAARGRVAGLLVLDTNGRRLAMGVAFGDRPVLVVDLDAPDPASLASLERVAIRPGASASDSGILEYAARVADALSAERIGHRFFRQFRATLGAMAAALPAPISRQDRHDFALLQLTRVLFLYFVQAKGWLAGRDRFLGDAVDHCLARDRQVHRDLLRPLFFGTLNRPVAERSHAARAFGAIPFLNGGLFEPHPLERRYRADLPNHLWRDAFDHLFEGFHFTIAERDRRGAVAPDMLGRVFEGVMDPEMRRSTGTFYTPAALVERLIDAGLAALLAERMRCGAAEAARRLHSGDAEAVAVLETATVLDPAVGSGAFLLGALERLAGLGGTTSAARKRRILQRNLFGVDRNPTAVRLTELRLWLAIIADDPGERADDIAPLPNLDCLVRQGDSLFDPTGLRADTTLTLAPVPMHAALAADLAALREETVTSCGANKAKLVRRLRATELQLFGASLETAETRLRSEIEACLADAQANDLFGNRRGLDRALHGSLRRLRAALRETRRARRQIDGGEVPWFHYRSHFADVFTRSGGFDLIIGNPPWQRAAAIPPVVRQRLAARYRWWRGRGSGYGNRPDLAVAFLERAIELAAPGGTVALLVPAKLASAGYGAAARHALAADTTLRVVADLEGDRDADFDATVYPLAVVATKAAPPAGHRACTTLAFQSERTVPQAELAGGGPWVLLSDQHRRALAALRADHPRLDERFACHLGLKTGANTVFLQPPADLEPEVIRWAVRGRDVRPFRITPSMRLLWTHGANGRPRTKLPPRAAAYLAGHHATLRARTDFTGGVPWVLFRVGAATARHRVIWSDLARQLTAAALTEVDDDGQIPLNTCYVAPADSAHEADRLAAWLNSTWIRAGASAGAVPASGGFARFNAATVGAVPLPPAVLRDPELIRLSSAARRGAGIQDELDAVAARHLDLSARDQATLRSLLRARSSDRR